MSVLIIIREVLLWNLIFFATLVGFARRPEDKTVRRRLNKEAWDDIKINIMPSIITGTLPILVLFRFPDKDGFKANAEAFIPLNQVIVYFSALFLLGLIFAIWNVARNDYEGKLRNFVINISILNLRGVFQIYSGVILAFSLFALKIGFSQYKWLILSALLVACAYAMFTPIILADHIERYYNKKKSEYMNSILVTE